MQNVRTFVRAFRLNNRMRIRHIQMLLWSHEPTYRCLTCFDAPSVESSVQLIKKLSRPSDDLDTISQRLEKYLAVFPPHERVMRRLSIHQQCVANTKGEEEFCVTLVFAMAMLCIEHAHRRRVTHTRSAPPCRVRKSFKRLSRSASN